VRQSGVKEGNRGTNLTDAPLMKNDHLKRRGRGGLLTARKNSNDHKSGGASGKERTEDQERKSSIEGGAYSLERAERVLKS